MPAIVRENIATILNTFTDDGYTTKLEALAHELQLARVYRVQDGQVKKAKTSGNLTNGFVYHNGKLVVENRPHPLIIRDHFPGIMADKNFEFQDVQAGLIFEENGKVYPVFHSYTAPSQEHKREALAALENYYHRPIGEELDYDEAMNRLSHVSRVEIVDHPYDDR